MQPGVAIANRHPDAEPLAQAVPPQGNEVQGLGLWKRLLVVVGIGGTVLGGANPIHHEAAGPVCDYNSDKPFVISDQSNSVVKFDQAPDGSCRPRLFINSRNWERPAVVPPEQQKQHANRVLPHLTEYQEAIINSKRNINETQRQFLRDMVLAMMDLGPTNDINRIAVIAMGILESSWGQDLLARTAKNPFGMKCWSSDYTCTDYVLTHEDDGTGRKYTINSRFRSYRSFKEAINALEKDMVEKWYYQDASKHYDRPEDSLDQALTRVGLFLDGLLDGNMAYATDTTYKDQVLQLVVKFDLHKLIQGIPRFPHQSVESDTLLA